MARPPGAVAPCKSSTAREPAIVKKTPDLIDRHVGSRVRMRRMLLKMSSGKAWRSARAHLSADPEIRKRPQPDRREPSPADLQDAQCAAGVFLRGRAYGGWSGGSGRGPCGFRRRGPDSVCRRLHVDGGRASSQPFVRTDPKSQDSSPPRGADRLPSRCRGGGRRSARQGRVSPNRGSDVSRPFPTPSPSAVRHEGRGASRLCSP